MSSVSSVTRLQIGELAERTGASRRSLRYYEQQGLLNCDRDANGYRLYDVSAVDVVLRIKGLLRLGLPIVAVRAVLPCVPDRDLTPVACPELQATLRAELERLNTVAEEIDQSRRSITTFLQSVEPNTMRPVD